MYYVIPDLHGRYDLLQKALKYIYKKQSTGKIIFLGDYIDRGTQNVDVLLTVMNPPDGWEFVTLKGNHEQIFCMAFDDPKTYHYYDDNAVREISKDPRLKLRQVFDWIKTLPILHIVGKNIFAHAFYDTDLGPEEQDEEDVMWSRYADAEAFVHPKGYHLTHGHTPRKNGPLTAPRRTNLDCGAAYYGRLVIAEYEEKIAGPVNFVEFNG